MSQRALRAAVEAAEEAGLRFDRPVAAAQSGYGTRPGDEVRDVFVDARRFQGTVWTMVFALRHPEARELAPARLAWYRAREHG